MKKRWILIILILTCIFSYFVINKHSNSVIETTSNELLNNLPNNYKNYYKKRITISGKISKIEGEKYIYLQAYFDNSELNGYVKFNDTSSLKIHVENIDVSSYKIYDYIKVTGVIHHYDKKNNMLIMVNTELEENSIYDNYNFEVIQKKECNNELTRYIDSIYTTCIKNIYINYQIDKYELSYALKDKKITLEQIIKNSNIKNENNITTYELEEFNILRCSNDKYILLDKNSEIDNKLCLNE